MTTFCMHKDPQRKDTATKGTTTRAREINQGRSATGESERESGYRERVCGMSDEEVWTARRNE